MSGSHILRNAAVGSKRFKVMDHSEPRLIFTDTSCTPNLYKGQPPCSLDSHRPPLPLKCLLHLRCLHLRGGDRWKRGTYPDMLLCCTSGTCGCGVQQSPPDDGLRRLALCKSWDTEPEFDGSRCLPQPRADLGLLEGLGLGTTPQR